MHTTLFYYYKVDIITSMNHKQLINILSDELEWLWIDLDKYDYMINMTNPSMIG